MAIQMGAVTLVGLLAGIAPLVRVGSFVVGDPRHRRAEIGTGVAMLILNLSAAADVFIPRLRVPVWESGVAFAGVAAYGLLAAWRNPRSNGVNSWPRWRSL
jgi:hypothetical protein